MSALFTPGPWIVENRGWDGIYIFGMDSRVTNNGEEGKRFLAECSLDYDGAEANARLMSAAPDLLDALIAFEEIGNTMDVRKKISAAIAKAIGAA